MQVIELSAGHSDSAAALVRDGALVAGAFEAAFTRTPRQGGWPARALEFCVERAGGLAAVDRVVLRAEPDARGWSAWLRSRQVRRTLRRMAPGWRGTIDQGRGPVEGAGAGAPAGPAFDGLQAVARLDRLGAHFDVFDPTGVVWAAAEHLALGHTLGWRQGPLAFSTRGLGAAAVLIDPRDPATAANLDGQLGRLPAPLTAFRRAEDAPPDGVAARRVEASAEPRLHALLTRFRAATGCGHLLGVSLAVPGEPPACTPEDALRAFMGTAIDLLVVGDCFLRKRSQDQALKFQPARPFDLD